MMRKGYLWQAGWLRAAGEGTFVSLLFYILLTFAWQNSYAWVIGQGYILSIIILQSIFALRLKLEKGKFWNVFLQTILLSIIPVLVSGLITFLFDLLIVEPDLSQRSGYGFGGIVFILLFSPVIFLVWRMFSHAWVRFIELRKKRFLWALVSANLSLISIPVLLVIFVFVANSVASGVTLPVSNANPMETVVDILVSGIFPMLLIGWIGFWFFIIVVLPFVFGFSFLISRRLTPRIEELANETDNLRKGQWDRRVVVEGEDEVARLQENFNSMAETLQDTTGRLQAETEKVEKLLEMQKLLTASVSHELRTPVSIIQTYMDSMLEKARDHEGAGINDLQIIKQEIDRLQTMIDDLFTLSRAEVQQLGIKKTQIDINELLREVHQIYQPVAWRNAKLSLEFQPAERETNILVDPQRLKQVLGNLIQNAIRFTSPGGMILIKTVSDHQNCTISVIDTGEGIPEKDLPFIWDRFYRVEGHPGKGTGLGLAVVKELTESMDGKVHVTSMVESGSEFQLIFPIQ